jgi:hypothetical protein
MTSHRERKRRPRRRKGKTLGSCEPDWQPLIDLLLEDFMWMFEVELTDGTHLHAYKHRGTRRYIHLTGDGRAFAYEWREPSEGDQPAWYREVDPREHLDLVLPRGRRLDEYREFQERARQDSNLWPSAPEADALSS